MHWIISAPFLNQESNKSWLQPFVQGGKHTFQVVPATYNHNRSRQKTSASEWFDYLSHGSRAYSKSRETLTETGIITVFPQLAMTVGFNKKLRMQKTPLLAWTFNLGALYGGSKKAVARLALSGVDKFVVHSRQEIISYSEWLDFSPDKFHFVPLQRPVQPIDFKEDDINPFILSMGSARRDYRLFFDVMSELGYPTIVVAGEHAIRNLRVPDNITIYNNLNINQCHELVQKARINVVPIDNHSTASGQVTLIDSMMYARPTVATLTTGTIDYAEHGVNSLLVPASDHGSMKDAIESLWGNKEQRNAIGLAARKYVENTLSDRVTGHILTGILDELNNNAN